MAIIAIAISELEYFNYAVYIFEQLSPFARYLIGNCGISHLHFVYEPVAQKKTQILLYLGIAHIGAIHNLRLARTVFPHSEHVRYNFYIRPSLIHYTTPLFSTFGLLLLYYLNGTCQAPTYFTVQNDIILTRREDTLYDKSTELNLNNLKGDLIKDVKPNQEVADG
jgi:hypothetical protein